MCDERPPGGSGGDSGRLMHAPPDLRAQPIVFWCERCRGVVVEGRVRCPGCGARPCTGCLILRTLLAGEPLGKPSMLGLGLLAGARCRRGAAPLGPIQRELLEDFMKLLGDTFLIRPMPPVVGEAPPALHALHALCATDLPVLACSNGCGVLVPGWGEEPHCPRCGAPACTECAALVRARKTEPAGGEGPPAGASEPERRPGS